MITAQQRQLRKQGIGSSDIAAILGIDPWRTAADVYLSKTMEMDDAPNDAMQAGARLESVVLDWAEEKLGPITRDVFATNDEYPFLLANHDGLLDDRIRGVEAKTHRITSDFVDAAWGEENTDEVPDHVIVQCHHQMVVSDLESVYVPALIGGRGFSMFHVRRDDELCKTIIERATNFWYQNVKERTPPADSIPNIEVVKRIRREPGKVATGKVPVELVQKWQQIHAEATAAGKAKKEIDAAIIACLGDAEAIESDLGLITYMETERAGYTVQPTKFRSLKLKVAKPKK